MLSGIGLYGSLTMGKITESIIQSISMSTYLLVFIGRCKGSYNYYLPLLVVHALAIPVFISVFVLTILVNYKVIHATEFPIVLYLKFTIEFTKQSLFWTGYNIVTSLIGLYLFNVAYRAFIFARRACRVKN